MTIKGLTPEETERLRRAMLMRESSGNYGHPGNRYGYIGGYQFGAAALETVGLVKPGVGSLGNSALNNPNNWTIPGGKEAFLNNKQLQDKAFVDLANKNIKTLERAGVIGSKTSSGDIAGYVSAAHLTGAGGAIDLSKGVVQSDANKTTSASYFQMGKSAVTNESTTTPNIEKNKPRKDATKTDGDNVDNSTDSSADTPNEEENEEGPYSEHWKWKDEIVFPKENVLHEYASYTYGISFHILTPSEYNTIAREGKYTPGKNVLIASAGRFGNYRNDYFKDTNFFIENLEMESVIGAGSFTSNSNVVTLNFTVVEPYGLTFLSRLILASAQLGVSYVNARYLIQIDFFGYDDNGIPDSTALPGLTKYIPIVISGFDITHDSNGTKYHITSTVATMSGINQASGGTVEVNIGVSAKTVAEFFDSTEFEEITKTMEAASEQQRKDVEESVDQNNDSARKAVTKEKKTPYYAVTSAASAINSWNTLIAKKNNLQFPPNIVEFVIDKEIADSHITLTDKMRVDTVAFDLSGKQVSSDGATSVFPVNAGTSIIAMITEVLKHSEYVRSNIIERAKDNKDLKTREDDIEGLLKNKEGPINWFRIIPITELVGINGNVYATKTVYYIRKYVYWNKKYPFAKNGMPRPESNSIVRYYQYYYTGKNRDILDWEIRLNTTYFINITPEESRLDKTTIDRTTVNPSTDKKDFSENSVVDIKQKQAVAEVTPIILHRTDGTTVPTNNKDSIQVKVEDLTRTMLTSVKQADMMEIDARIIGDPFFIKQDSVFYPPHLFFETTADNPVYEGGIVTENGNVFVHLTFRNMEDYNEQTGVMNIDSVPNTFDGIYMIISLTSTFNKGKFEQTLKLVRVPGQLADALLKKHLDENSTRETLEQDSRSTDNPNSLPGTEFIPSVVGEKIRGDEFGDLDRAIRLQRISEELNISPSSEQAQMLADQDV